MWHKSTGGDGVLEGAQAALLKRAVAVYVEYLYGSDAWSDSAELRRRFPDDELDEDADETREQWLGVAKVRHMEHDRRICTIASVVRALLDPAVPAPELTADNEAAVYQVYRFLVPAVEVEYDMQESDSTRSAIAAAFKEIGWCKDEEPEPCGVCDWCEPDMAAEPDDWSRLVEILADQVLWDRDWEMTSLEDAGEELGTIVKHIAGIEQDYFTAPAEEPTPATVDGARAYLEALTDEVFG